MYDTIKLEFRAGICTDDSPYSAEGWHVSSNGVRFWRGRPELIGGWDKLTATTFTGICRGAVQWNNLDGDPRLVFGTQSLVYAYAGGVLRDVTPYLSRQRLGNNPLVASGGVVTATAPNHGLKVGESFTMSNASAIGTLVLNATHTVASLINNDAFTFVPASGSGTSAGGGGDQIQISAALPAGALDADDSPFTFPRTWSMDRFGEMAIAIPDGRKLFAGVIASSAPSNIITNGTFTSSASWALGTGWSVGGTAFLSQNNDSNLSQNISTAKGGRPYRLTFDAKGGGDSPMLDVNINAGETPALVQIMAAFQPPSSMRSYALDFVMPARPVDLVFHGDTDSSETIEIDNVTLTELELAAVDQAPAFNIAGFTDPHGVVVLLGTIEVDGDFNAMCVRNCDIGNLRTWVPDTDNIASEFVLNGGGYLMAGVPTRGRNIIWSDTHTFSQQWVGAVGNAFEYDTLAKVGLYARFAYAESNGLVFFIGSDENFNVFDGGSVIPIECPVRDDFFSNLNKAQKSKIASFVLGARSEWWVFYPRGSNTECSDAVVYNFAEKHWVHHELDRTFGLDAGPFGYPLIFATNSTIYRHEKGTLADGEYRTWHLHSGYVDIKDGRNLMMVTRYWPDSASMTGPYKITFKFRNTSVDFGQEKGPFVVGPTTRMVNFRGKGRQMQIKWSSSDHSEAWRGGVQRFDAMETGARR